MLRDIYSQEWCVWIDKRDSHCPYPLSSELTSRETSLSLQRMPLLSYPRFDLVQRHQRVHRCSAQLWNTSIPPPGPFSYWICPSVAPKDATRVQNKLRYGLGVDLRRDRARQSIIQYPRCWLGPDILDEYRPRKESLNRFFWRTFDFRV